MSEPKPSRRARAVHFYPIVSVMVFWLGACVASSLLVETPHITQLGFVTLPLVAAAVLASVKLYRALDQTED